MLPTIRTELSALKPLRDFSKAEPSDYLVDDLGLDSLHHVELAMLLEERLHIELPDHVIARWQTVADVCASVERAGKERVCG